LPDGNGGDSGGSERGRAIRAVRRGRRDAEDDAVAVLDLEREGPTWRAVRHRDAKREAEERMERIDDGDGLDRFVLTALAPWGIKNIPRSMAWRG
jgi:hypothetical protein